LPNNLFIGKPGWDRYDGRLLQGTGVIEHRFTESLKLNVKARYIDSNLTYLTHYPDNYSNPTNPFLDTAQRTMTLYADGTYATMNVFSTDNNVQWDFNTGENVRHVLLGGIDYSWNRVNKRGGFGFSVIDIYNINYAALPSYNGGLPPDTGFYTDNSAQKQTGFYIQDQIRLWDRASVVLGARRDHVVSKGTTTAKANNTSLRGGVIAEVFTGVSPFFSYTESFEPISGTASNNLPFKPKQGRQYEAGVKFHAVDNLLLTATAYHIKERNRPVDDPSTPNPNDQMQAGSSTSKGFELEGRYALPDNFDVLFNYSFVEAEIAGTGHQLENVPKNNASIWGTKTFAVADDMKLRMGAGVRYTAQNYSFGPGFPNGVRTPSFTLVDALAEVTWKEWTFAVNATNVFNKDYYSACLARGDCFNGTARNIFGTLTYRF
jgi:iron complex outermembrane receptor protein